MTDVADAPASRPPDTADGSGPAGGRTAVIGAGIAGLVGAHDLIREGADVEVFEASDRVGGLGTFFEHDGDHLDRFYHVILPTDDALLGLLDDLGFREDVYWSETSLGFFHDGDLYRLDTALDLLRFRPVPFSDRLRLGWSALRAAHFSGPEGLDDITVEDWLVELSGQRAFDAFWRPLLEAKFGPAYRRIPALWYWAAFNREKGTQKEVKGYVRGGYRRIADELARSIESAGGRIHLETPVERLRLADDGRPAVSAGGEERRFDQVLSTVPLPVFRGMAADGRIDAALEGTGEDLDYQGVVNVVVLMRRSLTPHYWIPVVDCGVPFQGIVETTHALDRADTGGHHLVYLPTYVHRSEPHFSRDADDLRDAYLEGLFDLFPGLEPDDLVDAFVFKAPFVEPLYSPGYRDRRPPTELIDGRVFLATSGQVYPDVTSWNSSTALAREAVGAMRAGAPGEAAP